jgi:RNA polymerase sigma-70 factor (ECF subfamily)
MTPPPETTLDEANLVSLAHRGDGAAWETLVHAYQERVFRLAYLFVGDADDAQDVAQETFIRAFQNLHRFDPSRSLQPWLLSIAANLARNRLRSVSRYLAALQRLVHAEPKETLSDARSTEQKLDAQVLWEAIHKLKSSDQQVIYLRYFLELSETEIAQTLEIPPGTVKSRLHRAMERLRLVVQTEAPWLEKDSVDER